MKYDAFVSKCVPGEIEFAVLSPPDFDPRCESLPLLINMHGGGLDRNYLSEPRVRSLYDRLWDEGALPRMLVACYSARNSWHLNYLDGSELWEDLAFDFLELMRLSYNTSSDRHRNYLVGISMGALGALRLMLKYPSRFGAVVAIEGVINPVLDYRDLQERNFGMQHNGPREVQGPRWGWPVNLDHYHANNHANIVQRNAEALRSYAPKIYIECGDHDYYNAHDGAEFLHRVLWQNRIGHEYRLLQDCDHVGSSLSWRVEEAHRWLGRMSKALIHQDPLPEPTAAQVGYLRRAYRGEAVRPPNEAERLAFDDERSVVAHRRALPDFLARYSEDHFGGVFREPGED